VDRDPRQQEIHTQHGNPEGNGGRHPCRLAPHGGRETDRNSRRKNERESKPSVGAISIAAASHPKV
jgi:hypothetical protein